MLLLTLYLEFFRIGLFAVGGGLATIPFLQELTTRYTWITSEGLLDVIAIAESTPGPIGANAATYVGYNAAGLAGSLVAVLGLVTPSVIIILTVAHFFDKFKKEQVVKKAFWGIRPMVAGLVGAAGFEVAKLTFWQDGGLSVKAVAMAIVFTFLVIKWKKHPVVYIVLGGIAGILLKM